MVQEEVREDQAVAGGIGTPADAVQVARDTVWAEDAVKEGIDDRIPL